MINSSLKEKYWDSSTDKQMVISVVGTNQKIDNSMLEIGTFALEESLCSEPELKFGACEANCVKFTARNTAGSIIGKTISIEETIDGDSENPMPYGVFKVASDVPTADRTKRQITAYDAMYDIINTDVKTWYAGLSFPMTLKQFRDSFFAHLGIDQVETNLVNDSMTVNKTIVATQTDDSSAVTEESAISGKTVVTAICEINGCFGNINREGKFEYVFLKEIISALYPAEDLFPSDNLFPSDANTESMTGHYITFDYEDFQSKAITQLEIKTSEDNAGAIVGTTGNNYSITGNFLVSDKTGSELEQIANNLLPIMAKAAYTPIKSCTCVGNPCLELGEAIRFNTTREVVETYLLQRTLTGVQSKRDSISAQGTQTHSARVNSIRDTIESVERRTGKLERNADHLQSKYEDLEEQTNSKFEQTADAITAEVTRAQGAEDSLGSRISQTADAIEAEVINRQNADSEMSTKISQTAHSVSISASGSGNTAGITIALYDENGNLIDTEKTANITITGFVSFFDLANSGSTTINGDNITTGTIRGTNSEFTNVKFLEKVYYRYEYGGQLYDYPIFNVDQLGILDFCGSGVHVNFGGSWLFKDSRVYLGSMTQKNQIATIGDIPSVPDTSKFAPKSSPTLSNATLTGSIDAIGIKGNSSSASANVRCQDGSSTGYLAIAAKSSQRYKHDIADITDDKLNPERLYDLPIRQFVYNLDYLDVNDQRYGETVCGFIAEEIANVYPVACEYNADGAPENWDIRYVIPPMLSLIQKQHQEIESLKQENISLKGEVDILKQRLGKMEEMLNVINSKIN